ncbi:hypothetical protein [Kribbella sp. NPDC049227]|uniref:hypothetical protein n=1 Tax=Kribbella sp. NPDC049227 TaxID=3364113 RepID=UPI003711F5C1
MATLSDSRPARSAGRCAPGELPGYRLGTGAHAEWRLVKSEVIAVLRTRWNQDQHHDLQATVAAADSKE